MTNVKSTMDAPVAGASDQAGQAIRHSTILLAAGGLLLVLDAVLTVVWSPLPQEATATSSQAAIEFVRSEARAEALWAAGGNLLAAVGAALAAWWLHQGRPWGRMLGLSVITGFGFYRFTILFDLLGELAFSVVVPNWVSGLRILVAVAILPCVLAAGAFLTSRSLTRSARHRALIGADDGPEPPAVRLTAYLLFVYGLTWLLIALIALVAFGLWSDHGGYPRSLDFARTIMSGTLGCLGGAGLLGAGLALWFGYTRRVVWRATLCLAGAQLAGSVAMFLWEAVPNPDLVSQIPTGGEQLLGQIINGIIAVHILLLFVTVNLLWSPRLSAYFRSRGSGASAG